MNADTHLRAIKAVHTVIWAFFAGCVLAIPFQAWRGNFGCVLVLIGFVGLEIVILAFNSGQCLLTGIAARCTRERRGNFDIYLPE